MGYKEIFVARGTDYEETFAATRNTHRIMSANERSPCMSSKDTHGKHIHDELDEDLDLCYKVDKG